MALFHVRWILQDYIQDLSALRKRLEIQEEKYVSADTIIDLAEVVLKNKLFTFG